MNRSERKNKHTAEKRNEAFLTLTGTKALACITGKEIHLRPGGDPPGLVCAHAERRNARLLQYFPWDSEEIARRARTEPTEQLYLRTLSKTGTEQTASLGMAHRLDLACRHIRHPAPERHAAPEQRDYMTFFSTEELRGSIKKRLSQHCRNRVDTILSVLRRVVRNVPAE